MKFHLPHTSFVLLATLAILTFPESAHAGSSITGCAVSMPPAVTLQNEGDHQIYDLLGDPAIIKINQRVNFPAKREKTPPANAIL